MAWLFINTFHGGINTDNARIMRNQALKMENLNISKTGLMQKRLGFTDLGLTGTPATINTIYEWSNNVATNQNMVVELSSSDLSHLYQSADAASFIILENQLGNFIDRKTGNYLPAPTSIASIDASDLFFSAGVKTTESFMRSPLGLSLATTDGVYDNWLLHNITRATVRVITNYTTAGSPSAQIFNLNAIIAGQGKADHFYIMKNDWDKVYTYSEKNGVLRGGVGNASQNVPFWLGYINGSSFYNGAFAITDYVMLNNQILRGNAGGQKNVPWSPVRINSVQKISNLSASNFLDAGIDFHYRFSLVYDDFQEGFLTSDNAGIDTTIGVSDNLRVNFEAYAGINPRIRQINIYRSIASDGTYNFIDKISMNEATWSIVSVAGVKNIATLSYIDTNLVAGDSFQDRTGLDPTQDQPLINYNYKYEVQISERRFIAGTSEVVTTFDDGDTDHSTGYKVDIREYFNRVYWSHITPQLVICPDIFLKDNWMTFGEGGSDKITGIARILNNLIVFLESTTFVVRMTSGNVLTWEKQETIAGIGCVASDSIADAGGRILFAGRDNIYIFDLTAPIPLLDDKFEEDYQAISSKSTGKAVYYPKRRQYKITFAETETSINGTATSFITYVIDIKTGAVHKHHSTRDSISYAIGIDGELFRTDGAIIMQDDDSVMTETIGIGYRSSMIDAGSAEDKNWKNILLHYQSDDDILVKFYIRRKDKGRLSTSLKTITFPAKSGSMTTKIIELNEVAEALQIEIYSANSANTTIKIGQIGLEYE